MDPDGEEKEEINSSNPDSTRRKAENGSDPIRMKMKWATEMNRAIERINFLEQVQLIETNHFDEKCLKGPGEEEEMWIKGIANGGTPDTIYFNDTLNGKIKLLHLHNRLFNEVRYPHQI